MGGIMRYTIRLPLVAVVTAAGANAFPFDFVSGSTWSAAPASTTSTGAQWRLPVAKHDSISGPKRDDSNSDFASQLRSNSISMTSSVDLHHAGREYHL